MITVSFRRQAVITVEFGPTPCCEIKERLLRTVKIDSGNESKFVGK